MRISDTLYCYRYGDIGSAMFMLNVAYADGFYAHYRYVDAISACRKPKTALCCKKH